MDERHVRPYTSAATSRMQATLTRAPLLNGCLDPGDVSVQEAYGARPCGRHRPAVNAVAHLPRFVLAGEQLDIAIRGGLIACDASPAPGSPPRTKPATSSASSSDTNRAAFDSNPTSGVLADRHARGHRASR